MNTASLATSALTARSRGLALAAVLVVGVSVVACSSATPAPGGGGTGNGNGNPSGNGADSGASEPGADGGGTGTTPDGSTEPAVAPAKACADVATAFCAKIAQCSPFALSVSYGDQGKCRERLALNCPALFTAPGTSATPAKSAVCATAIGAVACDDFVALKLGPACDAAPGARAIGAACGDDAQCASTFCARGPASACGICSPTTIAGGACVNGACSRGTVCPEGGTRCVAPGRGKAGDACTVQEDCDLAHAVGCNTSTKRCLALTVAPAGGTCGASGITATSFAVCPAAGACTQVLNGRCTAAAADGASCSTADTGPSCMAPAQCIGGTCKVVDPATCK